MHSRAVLRLPRRFLQGRRHGVRRVLQYRLGGLELEPGRPLPVDSSDNPAREGMPDLSSRSARSSLALTMALRRPALQVRFRLPLRGAMTTKPSLRSQRPVFPANLDIHDRRIRGLEPGPVARGVHRRALQPVFLRGAGGERDCVAPAYEPGGGYGACSSSPPFRNAFLRHRGRGATTSCARRSRRAAGHLEALFAGLGISWILGIDEARETGPYGSERS